MLIIGFFLLFLGIIAPIAGMNNDAREIEANIINKTTMALQLLGIGDESLSCKAYSLTKNNSLDSWKKEILLEGLNMQATHDDDKIAQDVIWSLKASCSTSTMPLYNAVKLNRERAVRFFLSMQDDNARPSWLHSYFAVRRRNAEILQMLIQAGACCDRGFRDTIEDHPVIIALQNEDGASIELITKAGIDLSKKYQLQGKMVTLLEYIKTSLTLEKPFCKWVYHYLILNKKQSEDAVITIAPSFNEVGWYLKNLELICNEPYKNFRIMPSMDNEWINNGPADDDILVNIQELQQLLEYEASLDQEQDCPICFEPNPDTTTACKHSFCEACLASWLEKDNSCPLCRRNIK